MNVYGNKLTALLVYKLFIRNTTLRRLATRLFVPDCDVDIALFGSNLRINRRKELGYYRAYKASFSNVVFRDEIAPLLNLALLLERGDTFVDVGANVGLYSGVLGRFGRVAPSTRWIAFEANPDTASRLRQSASDLDIEVINIALSNKVGTIEFTGGAVSGVFGAKEQAGCFQFGESVTVPCTRLDQVKLGGGRLVIKIDVEGHELQVLEGAQALFDACRVKAVYVDGYSDRTLPTWLMRRGFTILNGRSLVREVPDHSLLALHNSFSCA